MQDIDIQEGIVKILEALNEVQRDVKVVAIDGRCAAGKTTLARQLAGITEAGLIHMDDFFLPKEMRTESRLKEPGGSIHYERFAAEVLPAIRYAVGFEYMCYDCRSMSFHGRREVHAGLVRIVEGAYSCHPFLGDYMDIRVFCDIAPLEQRLRLKIRNGEDELPKFLEKWVPREEKYINRLKIRERANIIL